MLEIELARLDVSRDRPSAAEEDEHVGRSTTEEDEHVSRSATENDHAGRSTRAGKRGRRQAGLERVQGKRVG
ncbi:hypothetical protein PanWU01x14_244750 [Parasponia andersonii]|uniref:Uncharacterized protein n=1 Tax=Parasponia andersonii TaxID=3476 RepID=A0A2P5BF24_PARAD|nr:hypothetical protein PanWU01x14_244750 [Parasponia andersonii]